jgi:hypothetical protein
MLFVCLLSAASLTACEQGGTKQELSAKKAKETNSLRSYQKPSAAIHFSSSYDGQTTLNELESFEIKVKSGTAGELTVDITNKENILSAGNIQKTHSVVAGEIVSIPVAVTLSVEGKYYLNIHASINVNGKVQSKSFAIALFSDEAKERAENNAAKPNPIDGAVSIMQAKETITVK